MQYLYHHLHADDYDRSTLPGQASLESAKRLDTTTENFHIRIYSDQLAAYTGQTAEPFICTLLLTYLPS
jgi:hypothetical protein